MRAKENKEKNKKVKLTSLIPVLLALGLLSIALISTLVSVNAQTYPSGPTDIINNTLSTPSLQPGSSMNSGGGTITNMTLNATTINYRWKGFIGNINGFLALEDSNSNSLFDWTMQTTTGEIYATRNSTVPDWDSIACADNTSVAAEELALGITTTRADSINKTFNTTSHAAFYVGEQQISANSCRTIALNVNDTKQSSEFQEVLLEDGVSIIYASLVENQTYGFDNQTYDFQMIVAENASEGDTANVLYYFYVELI